MRFARTVLAGFFAIGLSAVAVPAHAAEGYSNVTVEVTISDVTQIGGRDIAVHAVARTSAGDPVDCTFKISFGGSSAKYVEGKNVTGSGSSFNHTFHTNKVPRDLTGFAVVSCTYDDATLPQALGGTARLSAALPAALQTVSSGRGAVNLLALGSDDSDNSDSDDSDSDDSDNDGLPNTGGERLLWLLIGLALVAGGTTVIVSSRDRDAEA
jgi:hypothetical protein